MPIDWESVQNTPGPVPDSSIIRDTRPVVPVVDAPVVKPALADTAGASQYSVPPTGIVSDGTTPPPRYTPDFSPLEAAKAGFEDTAFSAMSHAFDEPDFDYDPAFDAVSTIDQLAKERGRHFTDDQRAKLTKTFSREEFDWQLQRLTDAEYRAEIAGQEFLGYVAGNLADVDMVVGGVAGKIPALVRATKLARAGATGAAAGSSSAASYAADQYTPLTPAEIAFQVTAITAGSALGGYMGKVQPKKTPTERVEPTVDEPEPLEVTRGAD